MGSGVLQLSSGVQFRARTPGPYRYCRAGAFHLVLDGNKNNCITFPEKPGAVSFGSEQEAREAADKLNHGWVVKR